MADMGVVQSCLDSGWKGYNQVSMGLSKKGVVSQKLIYICLPSHITFFLEKCSSKLCLDYILGNLKIKLWSSETKSGHRMLAPRLKLEVDGIFHHIPLGLLRVRHHPSGSSHITLPDFIWQGLKTLPGKSEEKDHWSYPVSMVVFSYHS